MFIIVSPALILIFTFNSKNKAYKKLKNVEIIGIINEITYDSKENVTIDVNKKKYYLARFNIIKSDGLLVGDSVYKKKNDIILELHSKSSKGFIYTKKFKLIN